MDIAIRPARPEDAEAATRLAFRAKAGWGYPEAWMEQWRGALTIRPDTLRDPLALAAVRGDELLGLCVVERPVQVAAGEQGSLVAGVLDHLWVAPEAQGMGVGRKLIERVLELAAAAGLQRLDIESDPYAQPFYARLGARSVGMRPAPMPGAPERVLHLMELPVPPQQVG